MPNQSTDIDVATGDGFDLVVNGEIYVVKRGVSVMAESDTSIGANDTANYGILSNFGSISGAGTGVCNNGDNDTVINQTGGVIMGSAGVNTSEGEFNTTINYGSIIGAGAFGMGISLSSYQDSVENYGSIYGVFVGIQASVRGADSIYNAKTISSSVDAIDLVEGTGDDEATIDNRGLIKGVNAAIDLTASSTGSLTIDNHGQIDGALEIDGGTVTIRNTGTINGDVSFYGGAFVFNGSGGEVNGIVSGGAENDRFRAGKGGSTFDGGGGINELFAGSGADTFRLSALGVGDVDRIFGFEIARDRLVFESSVFTTLTPGEIPVFSVATHATSASDHLFYNSTTGGLLYDADGNGPGKAQLFANVCPGLELTAKNLDVV